ncbi:MAG: thioesterase [Eubacteriales bacterium]|nr:thioesterase [Eubacteriales bacterium]
MIFKQVYNIGLEDVGIDGKALNRTILAIMEDVAGLHSSSVGYGLMDIDGSKGAWVLLNWHVKIIKRPVYKDKVVCHTWSRGADRLYALRDFELYSETGELLAAGASRWIMMNLEKRRPVRIDEELVSIYKPELDRHVFNEDIKDITAVASADYTQDYHIMRRDMDINGHVHNLSYLDGAYEVLPIEVYKTKEFNEIRISYKKEIRPEDKVRASYKAISKDCCQVVFASDSKINAVVQLEV